MLYVITSAKLFFYTFKNAKEKNGLLLNQTNRSHLYYIWVINVLLLTNMYKMVAWLTKGGQNLNKPG
jgi:hypothetical protein